MPIGIRGGASASLPYLVASGTDTYTGSYGSYAAYQAGDSFDVLFTNGNTGASTININSLGAKAITKNGSTALQSGDIVAGTVRQIVYDGTRFQLQPIGTVNGTGTAAQLAIWSDTDTIAGLTTLDPARGGTGVANNAASTFTISGNFGTTVTVSNTTAVTLPTSGTLVNQTNIGFVASTSLTINNGGTTALDGGSNANKNYYASSNATTTTITYSNMSDGSTVVIDYLKTTASNMAMTFPGGTIISVSSSVSVAGTVATFISTASGRFLITIMNVNSVYMVFVNQLVA